MRIIAKNNCEISHSSSKLVVNERNLLFLNSSMPANKEKMKKGYTNDSALPAAQYCPFTNKNMNKLIPDQA